MPILLAGKQLATPLPPVTLPIWTGTPAPSFTQGTASNYSFASLVTGGTSFASINAALPTGVTLNSGTEQLVYDGVGAAASVTGVVIRATNSNGSVDSAQFGANIAGATGFDFFISPTGTDTNAGTQGSPWSINALNSKQATYAGKKIGFIAGTYDIPTLYVNGAGSNYASWAAYAAALTDGYTPLFNIKGGTPGAPTVLGCVNGQGTVTWTCNSGTTHSIAQPLIGEFLTGGTGNITYDGLVFDGMGAKGIMLGRFLAAQNPPFSGYTVQNCEFKNQRCPASNPNGINQYAVEINFASGTTIFNNYFHNALGLAGAKTGDHFNTLNQWNSWGTTIDHNTIVDTVGFYGKEGGNQGTTLTNNYLDMTGWSGGAFLYQDGAGVPVGGTTFTLPTTIRNNIAIGGGNDTCDLEATLGNGGYTIGLEFSNNTIVFEPTVAAVLAFRAMCQSGSSRIFTLYNNLFDWGGRGASNYGNFSLTINGAGLIDYNQYGVALWTSHPLATYTSLGATGYSTLAAWQTAMAGSTGADAHSFVNPTTGYANTGTRANLYKLTGGAAGHLAGTVTGTPAGAATDLGAWGGTNAPAQIGASFAQ